MKKIVIALVLLSGFSSTAFAFSNFLVGIQYVSCNPRNLDDCTVEREAAFQLIHFFRIDCNSEDDDGPALKVATDLYENKLSVLSISCAKSSSDPDRMYINARIFEYGSDDSSHAAQNLGVLRRGEKFERLLVRSKDYSVVGSSADTQRVVFAEGVVVGPN